MIGALFRSFWFELALWRLKRMSEVENFTFRGITITKTDGTVSKLRFIRVDEPAPYQRWLVTVDSDGRVTRTKVDNIIDIDLFDWVKSVVPLDTERRMLSERKDQITGYIRALRQHCQGTRPILKQVGDVVWRVPHKWYFDQSTGMLRLYCFDGASGRDFEIHAYSSTDLVLELVRG